MKVLWHVPVLIAISYFSKQLIVMYQGVQKPFFKNIITSLCFHDSVSLWNQIRNDITYVVMIKFIRIILGSDEWKFWQVLLNAVQ